MGVQSIIAAQGVEYARHGWPLVLLPPRSKGERGMRKGWNHRENAVTDPDVIGRWHGNLGLLLAFAGVVSIDIDDLQGAHEWLELHGVDLMQLLAAPDAVRIESGRPGRAKLLYRVPDGMDSSDLVTRRIMDASRAVVLELRCAGAHGTSVQDVLPPSVHPDTGQPYRWRGDWRNLPALPPALLGAWRMGADAHDGKRSAGGPEFQRVLQRLQDHGCKPHVIGPGDARAHCPVHIGKSGTTLHINETEDGKVLLHCHAGCTWEEVFAALDMGPGVVPPMGEARAEAPRNAHTADRDEPAPEVRPELPASLCALPGRLGEVQDYIASTMYQPHAGAAGLVALALVDYLAMAQTRIASRSGLAMGEFFLVLAPSAFGKESLRLPFRKLAEYCARERIALPDLHFSAPSSQQGLQAMLIASRCVCMLPDEFGDWIAKGEKDQYREQAMAHLMQVYGNPFGTVDVPKAITRSLPPVREPRMVLFGTTTGERFVEVINGSLADRGFLNRFVMLPIARDGLEIGDENDDPLAYEIPQALASLAKAIAKGGQTLTFDADAAEYKRLHLRMHLHPLAERDKRLGGRINEQATRFAAAFALNDGRCVIDSRDMARGYEIREGLYAATAAYFEAEAVLTGDNPTMRALSQVRGLMQRNASLTRSRLRDMSRQFRRLGVREQSDVLRAAAIDQILYEKDGRVISLVYGQTDTD